jgi:hypothetical protein
MRGEVEMGRDLVLDQGDGSLAVTCPDAFVRAQDSQYLLGNVLHHRIWRGGLG